MSRSDHDASRSAWELFVASHRVGDVVAGRVTKVVPFGALVEVDDGVPGLLVTDAQPAADAQVSVRIQDIDPQKRRVSFTAADTGPG